MKYYANVENKEIKGFYNDDIHAGKIPNSCIEITEELWEALLGFEGAIRLIEEVEIDNSIVYTIENLGDFEPVPPVHIEEDKSPQELELEELRLEINATQEALNEIIMSM